MRELDADPRIVAPDDHAGATRRIRVDDELEPGRDRGVAGDENARARLRNIQDGTIDRRLMVAPNVRRLEDKNSFALSLFAHAAAPT